jgi:hypothetical protein
MHCQELLHPSGNGGRGDDQMLSRASADVDDYDESADDGGRGCSMVAAADATLAAGLACPVNGAFMGGQEAGAGGGNSPMLSNYLGSVSTPVSTSRL